MQRRNEFGAGGLAEPLTEAHAAVGRKRVVGRAGGGGASVGTSVGAGGGGGGVAKRLIQAAAWSLIGGLGAAVFAGWGADPAGGWGGARGSTAGASVFVADRDAGALVALDAELFEMRRTPIGYPLELEARGDGRLWVVCASALGPLGPHTLRKLDAAGAQELELPMGPLMDLDVLDADAALLVTLRPDGSREASVVTSEGDVRTIANGAMLAAIAGRSGRVLVGGHDGSLASYSAWPAPRPIAQRAFGGVIADVAPGPERDTFYVLDVGGAPSQRRLAVVDSTLATKWSVPIGMGALHLVVSADRQRVWLADGEARFARRFGPLGALEVAYAPLGAAGCERGADDGSGGVIFAAPGALVRLDARGAPAPGQGGFDFLCDVERRGSP